MSLRESAPCPCLPNTKARRCVGLAGSQARAHAQHVPVSICRTGESKEGPVCPASDDPDGREFSRCQLGGGSDAGNPQNTAKLYGGLVLTLSDQELLVTKTPQANLCKDSSYGDCLSHPCHGQSPAYLSSVFRTPTTAGAPSALL